MCFCVPNSNYGLIEKWSKKINNFNLFFIETVQLKERVLAEYKKNMSEQWRVKYVNARQCFFSLKKLKNE